MEHILGFLAAAALDQEFAISWRSAKYVRCEAADWASAALPLSLCGSAPPKSIGKIAEIALVSWRRDWAVT